LKKTSLTILIGFSIIAVGFSIKLYAEGNHKHKHADAGHQEHGDKKSDHKNHSGMHWASPKEASEKINPLKSNKGSIARGAKFYATSCVACHGEKAMGDGVLAASLDPKPTNLRAMSGGHTDGDFAWKIANGRGAMPGWNSSMSENDIWDLVNFIQNLKNQDPSSQSKDGHDGHKNHKH